MKDLKISKKPRTYIPAELNIQWGNLEPIFNELINRPLNSVNDLEQWLRDRSEIEAALEEDFAWRYIRMTCDTTDEKLLTDFQFFATEIEPKIAPLNNELNKKFIQSPFAEQLDEAKYYVYVRGIKKALELFREENIPLLTQIQVEQQKYQGITGSMSVKLGGQEYTLEQAAVFLKDTDRKVRQEAWEAITARRLEDKEKLDELFNSLLKLRHQVALNAGFENFRDYMFQALGRFDYTPTDCYDFHKAIQEEIVPLLKMQAKKRLKALALNELKPWDMDVDISGKPALKPFSNGEELIEKSIKCFQGLSPYIGERLEIMKANGFFDVDSRKGKAPGGYNYPLAESGAPFIFMNSAGTFRDLTTMVHEGGHAVHTFISAGLELNDFKHLPSEVAELASMSMELISMDHWDKFFDNSEDLIRAKKDQLKDVLKTLPWVAVVDQFQHWIYTNPTHTTEERAEAWTKIFEPFGNNFADWSEHPHALENLWQKQLHIFEVPFYYIEYGIAQLGAIAVWKNYKNDPEKGLSNYLEALKLGYTKTIKEIYETAGIEFNFTAAYVKELADFVQKELDKLE
ncbi:MAG: oligoendopeptidase F [Sphingobacteriales bacterium 17-39-43]|uniref:M3 family oligoendopeptidase n=1 Tax=Daejeonella sp. TaxID=2805397 RepID=UPI000BCC9102|nr:M3 family oligoendopeptidase [Daejeonella sp.]OYZ33371.1 MAG: oligoendopeptidase F [Sphingobacteriales bacterium 16-39-50]OZA24414.1 MAG: oligoendopeptidase F [Sphingobacteriales bacterium 17-39-43]HQT22387.1 M3 family oligoendopeptidase [Daejeonella sp.]HQT56772.1 M3 family oligoendopeptidase [Daejeonella sp.]